MQEATPHYNRRAERAYNFFIDKEATHASFTTADIVEATGYKASTVTRYIRMKWTKWFLVFNGNNTYHCSAAIHNQTKEDFIKSLSQGLHLPAIFYTSAPPQPTPIIELVEQPQQPTPDTTGYLALIVSLLIIAAFYQLSAQWRSDLSKWYWQRWWAMWWPLLAH